MFSSSRFHILFNRFGVSGITQVVRYSILLFQDVSLFVFLINCWSTVVSTVCVATVVQYPLSFFCFSHTYWNRNNCRPLKRSDFQKNSEKVD